ncbi:MAG: ROK family protein [Clostridia bacterium]|nr:ROK family protein [Clostridia bacterium]
MNNIMKEIYSIGIDIGASHIGIGIVNPNTGEIITKEYIMIKINGDKNLLIKNLIDAINIILAKADLSIKNIDKIGIGCPGDCDIKQGIIIIAPNMNLQNVSIKEEIQKNFSVDVRIQNDASCAIVGEYYFGCLKNIKDECILITLGTGVGFASINEKRELLGIKSCNELAGIFRRAYSPENHMHNTGSLSFLQKEYSEYVKQGVSRYEIFENIRKGDDGAICFFEKYLADVARAIESLEKHTNIKNYCIGGGISEYEDIFSNKLKRKLPSINLYISKFKNDSAIIGAAIL